MMKLPVPAFLVVGIMFSASFSARHALLVGNSNGGEAFERLKYVKNDVRNMQEVLAEHCGFEKGDIVLLYDKSAEELEKTVKDISGLLQNSNQEEIFLFYYSGHADLQNLLMGESKYPLGKLKNQLKGIPSKIRIAIFDACQSGSFTRFKGGVLEEPFLYRDQNPVEGQVVLYSSSENEYSQESDFYKGSIFTFHFINGLRGCADISGDNKVTVTEAYQYSYNHTIASTVNSTGGIQHPGYQFNIQGEGNIVLSDIASRSCGIVFEKDLQGIVTVINENQQLVAEVNKQSGRRLIVAVNPGVYEVYTISGDAAYKAVAEVNKSGMTAVGTANFRKTKTTPVYSKGKMKRIVRWGITVSGGGIDCDLTDLTRQCNALFAGYGYFNIYPQFTFPNYRIVPGLEISGMFSNGIGMFYATDYCGYSQTTGYHGYSTAPQDTGKKYGADVTIDTRLSVFTAQIGVGYRSTQRLLKYFRMKAALDISYANLTVSSTLSDSLFGIETANKNSDKGLLFVPRVSLDVSYPIARFLYAGISAGYRYQKGARRLIALEKKNNDENRFRYDLSGFGFNLFLGFLFN